LTNVTRNYCAKWRRNPKEDVIFSLKKGHGEGQTWGKSCHFKIWEVQPENKWGYHDNVRNLGRVMPAISISETLLWSGV
jgi:hypothetical protein